MPSYTQANRPIAVTTPLGPDALLLTGLSGHEGVSELFRFELQLLAESKTPVPFEKLLGQGATVEIELPKGGRRYLNGIVSRMSQGRRDETFTHFKAELVPKLWLLTKSVQSRIFQRLSVPDILSRVLAGLVVKIETSRTYEPRDYCTQYAESDFAFASRLMEEEGIRYYFRHSKGSHQLILTDDALDYPDLPVQSEVVYEELLPGGIYDETRVVAWEKSQEVRSALYTLRDHTFELPGQSLEAQQPTIDSVPMGKVSHKLKLAVPESLEIYEFPGRYAQRFDGIDAGGTAQPGELQKIFTDKDRTVRLRMEMEEMQGLRVDGRSYCRHFCPGYAFTLSKHFDADGRYLITRVEHEASVDGDYRSGGALPFRYENRFSCIPAALPYRPPRVTPRPVIAGNQTATIVAPPGEELFCDKYGRVKVLFHWDREGKRDGTSSCWIRVAQPWAGKGWGAFFWPRAGHEVVVSFEEGDPDQPVIVGSVYNAENPTPFPLPLRNRVAGIKSASVRGTATKNFNGVVFYDELGREHLSLHSERTMDFNTEFDKEFHAGRNRHESVSNLAMSKVGGVPGGGGGGGGPQDAGSGTGGTTGGGSTGGTTGTTTTSSSSSSDSSDFSPFDPGGEAGGLGLDSKLVVGEALLGVVGLNELIFLGSNLQLNVNPLAFNLLGGTPPVWLESLGGSGFGGNLLFTLGTNATVTVGRNIVVSDSEDTKFEMGSHVASKIVCAAIAIITIIWSVGYSVAKTLEDRVVLFAFYQPSLSLLLAVLMIIEGYYDLFERKEKLHLAKFLFKAFGWKDTLSPVGQTSVKDAIIAIPKTLAALALPIALAGGIAVAETHRKKD